MIPFKTIRRAAALIEGPGVLGGTGALQLLGYNVEAVDLDFLVEEVPDLPADLIAIDKPGASWGPTASIDGVKVDYILADATRRGFLRDWVKLYYSPWEPAPDDLRGLRPVFVANVEHVLALKAFAGRVKDREFFKAWGRGEIDRMRT